MLPIVLIIDYVFATLVSGSVLYFFMSYLQFKYIPDYGVVAHAKDTALSALAILFSVLVLWGVVHMLVVPML